jgi:hypothetical protein
MLLNVVAHLQARQRLQLLLLTVASAGSMIRSECTVLLLHVRAMRSSCQRRKRAEVDVRSAVRASEVSADVAAPCELIERQLVADRRLFPVAVVASSSCLCVV